MKKALMQLVTLMVIVTLLLSACSKSGDSKEAEQSNAAEPLKFTAMTILFGANPVGTIVQDEWQKRMEAYVGRKLDITWKQYPWSDYEQKYPLTLASGELPDIMTARGDELADQYGNQGIVLDIAPYIDQYAPNYKKFLDANPAQAEKLKTVDGKMFYFGVGWENRENVEGSYYGSMYRFDIFKQNNIKIPETQEEFLDAARKLKQLYPDVYPIGSMNWPPAYEAFYFTNHTYPGIYWNGKQYTYGPIEDSYKEGLMFYNQLYKEKLLDPEFATQSADQMTQKATTGKSFMFAISSLDFVEQFNSNGQGMEWGAALFPKNNKYGTAWNRESWKPGKSVDPFNGVLISAKTKNPELMVKLIDYQFSDEMIDLVNWGIEGKTYKVGADGKKEWLPEIVNADNPRKALEPFGVLRSGSNRPGIQFTPMEASSELRLHKPQPFYANGQYVNDLTYYEDTAKYGGQDAVAPVDRDPQVRLTKEEQTNKTQIMSPIDTYASEMSLKFITGEKSFSEWDAYKEQVRKLGDYESVLKMMNDKLK